MKKNTEAFSLVVAMGIVLVSSLLAYTILEYMIPFSRNVKGIENATKAYYNSNGGIERGLYFFSTRKDENIIKNATDGTIDYSTIASGYTFKTTSSGVTLPKAGTGSSEYDSDWNTIGIGDPIQLSIGYDFLKDVNDFTIQFRTPEIGGNRAELTGSEGYINWILTSKNGSLFADKNSLIKKDGMDVDKGNKVELKNLKGIAYDKQGHEVKNISLKDIFEAGKITNSSHDGVKKLNCKADKCILKFSIIRDLKAKFAGKDIQLPYLEWKVFVTGTNNSDIPLRYSIIDATGKSGGYSRTLQVKHPQDTVNQALDFAVFQ